MSRRLLILVAVVSAALLLVPVALAVRVHVRVEGKTQTIFGAAEPTLSVKANALDALEAASLAGEFYYHVTITGFGPYVDQIGRYPATASSGWVFKVNGVSPPVGADAVTLKTGDRVLWYWADFGPSGGPPTLELKRTTRSCYRVLAQDDNGKTSVAAGAVLHVGGRSVHTRNCYRVLAQDDSGKASVAAGAVLHVGGRSVRTRKGAACVGRHRGLVKATLAGAVRSNALA